MRSKIIVVTIYHFRREYNNKNIILSYLGKIIVHLKNVIFCAIAFLKPVPEAISTCLYNGMLQL